jgi:hypothetical protein
MLGPLADNGGPTLTMALGAGSPAIDIVVPSAGCLPTDQRGAPRPQGVACDAGAYEAAAQPVPPPPPPAAVVPTQPATPAADGGGDALPPLVSLLLKSQRLSKVLKSGFAADFTTDQPGAVKLEVFVEGNDVRIAKKAKPKPKRVALATATIAAPGTGHVVARFARRPRTRLAGRRQLRVLVVLTVTNSQGNSTTVQRRVTLKR